jgi:hypothetical protein
VIDEVFDTTGGVAFPIDVGLGNAVRLRKVPEGYEFRHLCLTSGKEDVIHAPLARHQATSEPGKPLTLVPSISCHCGLHGFVTNGRWVPIGMQVS